MNKEENELITRTGAGTPMGEVMRRFWIPAGLSSELPEADCPPVRVKLLGERLVAFRDTLGRIGVLDEFCAHRWASLFQGRTARLRYVYLTAAEEQQLRDLAATGVIVSAQDVPSASPVPLDAVLAGDGSD
jgi:hypothetical protein